MALCETDRGWVVRLSILGLLTWLGILIVLWRRRTHIEVTCRLPGDDEAR